MHPILFHFGPISIHSYGVAVALGFVAASHLAGRRAAALKINPALIQQLTLIALCAGILGARLFYVLLNWDFFRSEPLEIFRIYHGGLVFYGGLIAGFLAGILFLGKNRLLQWRAAAADGSLTTNPSWRAVDLMMPPLALAHALGRLGCFLNGCCYGKYSNVPWAVVFPDEQMARHPTQLYEMVFLIALFFFLKFLERKNLRPGALTFSYGLLYGVWRFLIEFLRGDNPVVGGGLTVFQWVSLPLIAFSAFLLVRRFARR